MLKHVQFKKNHSSGFPSLHIGTYKILEIFSNLKRFELDEIFRSTYQLYKFAIQFVPNNARANDEVLIERLKRKNPNGDKPLVYVEKNLNGVYSSVKDIVDENPTDNIGILFEKINQLEKCKDLEEEYRKSLRYMSLLKEALIFDAFETVNSEFESINKSQKKTI